MSRSTYWNSATLRIIEDELRSFFTEDWNYAYRRVGGKMESEYYARQALYALTNLRAALNYVPTKHEAEDVARKMRASA